MLSSKKSLIFVLFMFGVVSSMFSNKNYGLLDSGKVLGENEKITGFEMDLALMLQCSFWDVNNSKYDITVRPFFNVDDRQKYYMLMIPSFSFYFYDAYGLKNDSEFSYKINVSTPNFNKFNIYGPSVIMDLAYKKKILSNKFLFMAYKFGWALGYNAYPGIDIGVKNMILITTNTEKFNVNIIPFIQNSLIIGLGSVIYSEFPQPYVLRSSPIFTIEPGLELGWDINITEKFIFKIGLTTKYEIDFDLSNPGQIQGNLMMGLSLGWHGKYKIGEKKKFLDELDLSELE
ncbi:MAG TPA: hypothetical protein PLO89_00705 [Spirochaetota bacterium]|nr:hypothetical protein [Spirochaetota bacterium]